LLQWKDVIPGLAAEDHNVVLASALLFRTFNRPEVACEYCTGTASSRINDRKGALEVRLLAGTREHRGFEASGPGLFGYLTAVPKELTQGSDP